MKSGYTPITDYSGYSARGRANSHGHPRVRVPEDTTKPCTKCGRPIHPNPESSPSDWERKKTCGVGNQECIAIARRKRLGRKPASGQPAPLPGWGF